MNRIMNTNFPALIMPLYFRAIQKCIILLAGSFFSIATTAQQSVDTLKEIELEEVIVKAYEQNKLLKDVPAAVHYIGKQVLERFGSASVVSAINTNPGIRIEERSPGSYRFNIRGSALRSPFGVRNVKVYYNDLPYTNPGGHTFLNQLGYYNFGSIEIIKGPGSSLYGAGTGGVLLIESMSDSEQPEIVAEYTAGSYGLQNIYASVISGTEKFKSKSSYQHQQSDGYRDHSELKRDVLSWTGNFKFDEKRQLKTTFVYGDLFYETPGAITAAEYNADPQAARKGTAFFPGAEAANASVQQKTFLAGASYTQQLLNKLQSKTVFYGSYTQLLNPNIQSAERSTQPHFGGRTVFKYTRQLSESILSIDAGAEWQQGFTNISVHKNVAGNADSIRTYDEIANRQSLLFAQIALDVKDFSVVAGTSLNSLNINFERFIPRPLGNQERKFDNKLAPRLALLKKFNNINIYASVAKGFSPPTTEELLPSGGAINLQLTAEDGINYDLGLRGTFFKTLNVDINAFLFQLENTIVQRRDAGGGSFFLNAGKTNQRGVETAINYPFLQSFALVDRSIFWLSHTYHNFKYKDFIKDTTNFSGNKLPGIAPHTISTGIDALLKNGFFGTISYLFTGKTPLTDANNTYADSFQLLGAKIGFQRLFKSKYRIKFFAGADNLLNETYSLGNDVNGFGGRYYNAAPARNYYATISVQWIK